MSLKKYWHQVDKTRLKGVLHKLGSLLALAGVVFVIFRLRKYAGQVDFARLGSDTWLLLGMCLGIYSFAQLLLAKAWHFTLRHLGVPADAFWAIRTYGTSQLAKYVPGNIFHFAGRQALGMARGYQGMALLRSTVWELALQCGSGVFFGLMALPALFPAVPQAAGPAIFLAAVLGVLLFLARALSKDIAAAFFCDTVFLCISGLVFSLILEVSLGGPLPHGLSRPFVCGAFVVAWLAGLVVPGAPAGAGVRELVLLFLFKGHVQEADLLMAVILGRGVTVGGDVLFYLIALFMGMMKRPGAGASGQDEAGTSTR